MSTVITPRIRSYSRPVSRRTGVAMAVGGGVATVAAAVVLVAGGDAPAPVTPASPATATASAIGAGLSVSEQAAMYAALASGDPRLERVAEDVAAGRAGVSALADPSVLRHHRVDTSATPPARFRSRAAGHRLHHR
jgi:hypothetical protein